MTEQHFHERFPDQFAAAHTKALEAFAQAQGGGREWLTTIIRLAFNAGAAAQAAPPPATHDQYGVHVPATQITFDEARARWDAGDLVGVTTVAPGPDETVFVAHAGLYRFVFATFDAYVAWFVNPAHPDRMQFWRPTDDGPARWVLLDGRDAVIDVAATTQRLGELIAEHIDDPGMMVVAIGNRCRRCGADAHGGMPTAGCPGCDA